MTVDRVALINQRIDSIYTRIAALTTANGDGRNISVDGLSVDNTGKLDQLYRELASARQELSISEGPWEVETEGR